MRHFLIPRLIALLAAAAVIAAGQAAAEPLLRPSVVVSGDTIRLGDIFGGAGAHAAEAVAPAPAPGTHVTYGARWLASVAHEHHLAWSPGSPYDQVSIERASHIIGGDAIASRLLAELAARQPVNNATIQLDNPGLRFVVPADAGDAMAVDGFTFDHRTGRLSAVVSAPAGAPDAERQRITARVIYRTELPVLNHPLAPGDVITAEDLSQIKMRRDRIGPDVVADAGQLIGKTPRRPLRAEQPIRTGDVQVPVVIHKGELVTIVLETPSMRLTARGKAVADGAMGAAIPVANTNSKRVVDAVVTGPNTVTVGMPGAPMKTAIR
jgi:flagella basal body P-ring formation protein FlgA